MQNYRRSEYTSEERRIIVDYIIKCKCYNALRGNIIWKEMENKQIIQRTWQSLKEHFKKKIVDNIHTFEIPEKEKCLIRDGWNASRVVIQEGDRKVKRPRYNLVTNNGNENDNISDESDSSSSTYYNPNSRKRKIKFKNKNNYVQPSDPLEFNYFSDEEEYLPNIPPRRNMVVDDNSSNCDSPDLLYNNRQMAIALNSKTIVEPTTSRLNLQTKNNTVESIPIYSDSDDATVVNLDVGSGNKINDNSANNPIEKFSLEEDLSLINFIRVDKTYLQRKNMINIYNYYHEIYPHSKSPEQLMDRFLNHIFPNICTYHNLTLDEMTQFYKDAGVDIPDNLRALLKESNLNTISQNKPISDTRSENSTNSQKDVQSNICEHELSKSEFKNCIYSHITLKGKSHIFVSDLLGKRNKEKLADLLSKKFKIKRKYIHHINFVSQTLLQQINKFRNTIYEQFRDVFSENLQECCTNSDIETVITALEICVQSFSSGDEDSSSDSNDESTIIHLQQSNIEEFDPRENSQNEEIKEENISNETSCNAMLAASSEHDYILKIRDPLEIQDDLCSNSSTTVNINVSESDLEIVSVDELENLTELQEICIKSEPSSANQSEY